MEYSYGTGVGLKNRYDVLLLDKSVDPLDALKKSTRNQSKHKKSKKPANSKDPTPTQSKLKLMEQTQAKEKKPPSKPVKSGNKSKNVVDDKSVAKRTTPGPNNTMQNFAAAENPLDIEVPFARQLTLDEYKETNAANRRKVPQYNVRQAGEGEDMSQWEKLVPLEKKKFNDDKGENAEEASNFRQRARLQKRLPVDVTFCDCMRRRGKRHEMTVARVVLPESIRYKRPPKMDNEQEFPSLGQ